MWPVNVLGLTGRIFSFSSFTNQHQCCSSSDNTVGDGNKVRPDIQSTGSCVDCKVSAHPWYENHDVRKHHGVGDDYL